MPNIAIVSSLSMLIVQVQRAIKLQANKVEIFSHTALDAIPQDTDLIYFGLNNDGHDGESIEYLHQRLVQTPIIVLITENKIEYAIRAIRCGACDVVYISGDPVNDNVEIANSVYRGLRVRQNKVVVRQTLAEKTCDAFPFDVNRGESGGFLNQMQQAVVIIDQSAKVISFNRAAEKLIGDDDELGLQGKDISAILNLSEQDKEKIFVQGESHRGELRIRHEDQDITIGYAISPRYSINGHLDGAMMLFKDITEDKHLRFQAEKAEKMQTLGEIAAAISHEVKNPLAGIKSMVQAMMYDLEPESDNYHYTQRILQEVDRINTFIEDTFAFARHRRQYLVKVEISSIVNAVVSLLTENLKENQIQVEKQFEPELPAVKVDPDQIHQVFLNILMNAIEAIKEQPSAERRNPPFIKVMARKTSMRINHVLTPFVETLFEDSGPGIPESAFEKVFDPFFTTKPSGTGLGLSICYKIIREHHGELDLKNAVAGGAIVSVKLPVVPPNRFSK
ncbi:signal transduction histidine kinase, nitrogen specific, NtrB [Chloroherpeton thalassium ATCC 35110]|uniref:histidine kinase n=1 Tax=Chloroherpeton thalassium (strain ATCC 35110 / GB-78) TaxID=517418 RepID=B3QUH5_CHLT3|nr:ATP-binding protein [Chloroherpeton thalassium]ACF12881.1 signal transduction histidine kinase, nitrogen specific, NtrB [Chloroherpeton thalassium ATCC 35110]